MEYKVDYKRARVVLLELAEPVKIKRMPLDICGGMVLAQDLLAKENVPPFDRSPYDGYAFRAENSQVASKEHPVTLTVLEEVPAGAWPSCSVTEGTAIKVMTGAPIPEGADAVIMFEKTEFTETAVTLFAPVERGSNIVRAGEDVQAGQLLAERGSVIDAGLAGTLASQGEMHPLVYERPRIGIICTGNEVVETEQEIPAGKIRNSNRYILDAALVELGCEPVYFGLAGDREEEIADLIEKALVECDALLLTGGVSVGDYDLTPAAMERAGVKLLIQGVDFKPGMACAYGVKDGKMVCGLSGNPASAVTNFYAVVMPAIRKLAGRKQPLPPEISVTLADDFGKASRCTRILRGILDLTDGTVRMRLPQNQGNVVISSTIECNVMAVVPAGSGALTAGTVLKGFLL